MSDEQQALGELSVFLEGSDAGDGMHRAMSAVSAAESLTDALAIDLMTHAGVEGLDYNRFLAALHVCDFVIERNSEWHLLPVVRRHLGSVLRAQPNLFHDIHARLLALATESGEQSAVQELPRYLEQQVGKAYHGSFLEPSEGLHQYSEIALESLTGQQWLAVRLLDEQTEAGFLPRAALESTFLRAMWLYREGKTGEAEPLFRRIAERTEQRREVAIATHIVGKIDARNPTRRPRAKHLLRKSLKLRRELGDEHGEAQVLHTLGQLVGRTRRRTDEAEGLLRESLELLRELGDEHGEAQVLHTLGQLVGLDPRRLEETLELLGRSLEILEKLRDLDGQAQVLYSMARVYQSTNPNVSRRLLKESLSLNIRIGNRAGQRIVRKTLRNLPSGD